MTPDPPLIVIVGPTAVGKTAFSLRLATLHEGEIISADSRLFYRGLDIGTAKPAVGERALIHHHLIDICEPDETLTLGQYQRLAYAAISRIYDRGRLPLLVGGTGQYVKAVIEGWGIPAVPPQKRLRQVLASLGQSELNRWLSQLDPTAAERIDKNNIRRIIRALEVTLVSGHPISRLQEKRSPDYRILIIGLTCPRDILYERIDRRVDEMLEGGLLEEVRRLKMAGYSSRLPAMSGLGYRQLMAYLDGQVSLEAAVDRVKYETHRFVRQQNTWFRLDDPAVYWYEVTQQGWQARAEYQIAQWLGDNEIIAKNRSSEKKAGRQSR